MTVRILAVCGNGQGSSMIMKMKVDQFLTQSNIDHTVNSCAVGEYKSELSGADIIIASTHIAGEITVTGNKYVVGVRNMLSPGNSMGWGGWPARIARDRENPRRRFLSRLGCLSHQGLRGRLEPSGVGPIEAQQCGRVVLAQPAGHHQSEQLLGVGRHRQRRVRLAGKVQRGVEVLEQALAQFDHLG